MDYVTRQFINLSKKFRRELRSAISLLNKNIEHQNQAIREASDASKQRDNTPYILWTESKTAPSERYKQEAKDARDSIVKYWKAYAEVFGVMVVIAYTVVSFLQWRTAHDALKDAKESSVKQYIQTASQIQALQRANEIAIANNRPWIGSLQGPESDLTIKKGLSDKDGQFTEFIYIWRFKNSGQRPARGTTIHTTGHWYTGDCSADPDYRPTLKGTPGFRHKWSETSRALITPQTELYSEWGGPIPLDKWQLIDSTSPILRLCIYAVVEYQDVADPTITHHTKECREFSPLAGKVLQCVNNYTDGD